MLKYILYVNVLYAILKAFVCEMKQNSTFKFPSPVVELLHPKGFQVSIPDIKNIKAFEFQGNINKGFEIINNTHCKGQLSGWIRKRDQRYYAYINKDFVFNDTDTVYFWIGIHFHNATSIYLYNQTFTVYSSREFNRYCVYNDSRLR